MGGSMALVAATLAAELKRFKGVDVTLESALPALNQQDKGHQSKFGNVGVVNVATTKDMVP
jgi:hypothetical protein